MEFGSPPKSGSEISSDGYRELRWGKVKQVSFMAAPMVAVSLSQYLIPFATVIIIGHRGEVSLSGVALASSVANVSGFSLVFGFSGALETLCGQAYGAKQYRKLGSYTLTSVISLLLICIPISVLWLFMDKLLILAHQDTQVSAEAGRYLTWLIPGLFAYAILQSLVRYFQSQSLMLPMFTSSLASLFLHVPLCWFLVYKLGFGVKGAALSVGFSNWLNTALLLLYIRYSPSCKETRTIVLEDALASKKEYFSFAVPSAMMICFEWLAFEIIVLLSGLLPNSKLETSVISICLTTSSVHYNVVYAIGAAASTHVSNELGAGNPKAARAAASVAATIAAMEAAIVSSALFLCRSFWGYMFSNVKEVVDSTTEITPILCLSMFMDSFLAVLAGVVRGTGWQQLGAYLNIGTYYIFGTPVGILLCFVLDLRGKGLWIGILSGSILQVLLLSRIIAITDWEKESIKTRERIFQAVKAKEGIFQMANWDSNGRDEEGTEKLIHHGSEDL